MGLIREPRNVDFSMRSRPMTEQEQKEISEFIKMSKAAALVREKRNSAARKRRAAKA